MFSVNDAETACMINIAYIIDTIESPTAGTEKQLLMLLEHLDRTRFKPYLCVLRPSEWLKKEFLACELIDIGITSFAHPASYLNILKFINFLKTSRINIVQTYFVEGNKVGVAAARLAGTQAVIATRRNQGYWHTRFELVALRLLNRWVTCFLANSESTREWLTHSEGVESNRIKVVYNSLETERYAPATADQRTTFRQQWNFPEDAVVIGVVANLRPIKALDVFIAAARLVADKVPAARFCIVGDGPERPTLEALSQTSGLGATLRFLGRRTDIPQLLSCMDIGVLSSHSESFSNAIVEYAAAGLAVVCSDVGGAREAVEDGVTGYVVPSGDPNRMAERLISIIGHQQAGTMGQRGREKAVRLFACDKILASYHTLYEELV